MDAGNQTEAVVFSEHEKEKTNGVASERLKESLPQEQQQQQVKDPVPVQADLAIVKKVTSPRTNVVSDKGRFSLPQPRDFPLPHPGDTSLDSEMRVAGVEMIDPYDSSEGVGFSDSNLDEIPNSTHSLESFKSDRLKEELPSLRTSLDGVQSASSPVPVATLTVEQQPSSTVVERTSGGGMALVDLDLQVEEESSGDERVSSSSESDLRPHKFAGTFVHSIIKGATH